MLDEECDMYILGRNPLPEGKLAEMNYSPRCRRPVNLIEETGSYMR